MTLTINKNNSILKTNKKNFKYSLRNLSNNIKMSDIQVLRKKEENIWKFNGQKNPKFGEKHQPTDTSSLANPKQERTMKTVPRCITVKLIETKEYICIYILNSQGEKKIQYLQRNKDINNGWLHIERMKVRRQNLNFL